MFECLGLINTRRGRLQGELVGAVSEGLVQVGGAVIVTVQGRGGGVAIPEPGAAWVEVAEATASLPALTSHHVAEDGGDDAEGEGDGELPYGEANVHPQEELQEILVLLGEMKGVHAHHPLADVVHVHSHYGDGLEDPHPGQAGQMLYEGNDVYDGKQESDSGLPEAVVSPPLKQLLVEVFLIVALLYRCTLRAKEEEVGEKPVAVEAQRCQPVQNINNCQNNPAGYYCP